MALAIAVTGSGVAWAAGPSGGSGGGSTAAAPASPASSEGSLQIQAQELAGQIQANGVQLDQLDEAYNAAELQYLQIGSQVAGLQKAMAQTDRTVAAVKREMRSQAVLDYITGGAPIISHVPVLPSNPNLATSYAEIIAGSQRRAIDAYHQVMLQQARQDRELESARQQAAVTLTAIQTDRAAATQALAQQRSTLDQVKGKLALAVAAVEAQQQRAEQIAVETSLTQQGQLPSASSAASAAGSSAATHPGGSPGAGGSSGSNPAPPVTTDPVGPSQPVISPTTPAPDPTTAPPTSPGPTTPPTTAPVAGPPAAGSG
ncbi:MAG TPA: hypothetical protein VLX59_19345, partial [Acidimicrobiales bacterium]|nr:hypothetical protein [Acidimicrobiales bacterium]